MSMPARRVWVSLVVCWFVSFLVAFPATHRIRGPRLVYGPSDELTTAWSTVLVSYQTLMWATFIVSLVLFGRRWWHAKRTGRTLP
jgi:hypothetical protein